MTLDFFGPEARHQWLVLAGLATAAALIFVTDITIAHGYAVWVLYLPLCVGAAWLGRGREAIAASAIATVLITVGWLVSPQELPLLPAMVSRALEATTIWLAVILVLVRQRSDRSTELAFKAAREANDRLSGIIINNAEDAIICIDAGQKITLFNHGAERIFGYSTDEAIGKNLSILLPVRAAGSHDGFVRAFGASAVQSRRMGERGAVAGVRKDGSEFPAEISISKLPTPAGMVYTAILRDISERVKAEELFREREQRLRLAVSAGQMGTFQIDERMGTTRLDDHAARLLGLPSGGDAPSVAQFRNVHPEDREHLQAAMALARSAGGEVHEQFRIQAGDTPVRWLSAHAFVELDPASAPRRTTGVLYDITDRKEVEQALEARVAERTAALREEISLREETQTALVRSQKLQAVGELAGGMAHDFNNLLTVISGNHELLETRLTDAKAIELLKRAQTASDMAVRLTNRLLTFARRRRLEPVVLDLNEQVLNMSELLKRTLDEPIKLRTILAPDLWVTRADPSEIENAVLNLAINARDAMPGGGRLVIQTENTFIDAATARTETGQKAGQFVRLSVTDTGMGMPPDVLARAFEPFFTTKDIGRGTGLGLSTIYGFVQQSGGFAQIYSEVGEGTTVNIYLPRANGQGASEEMQAQESVVFSERGETILVVEDNDAVREVTLQRIEGLGYAVLEAPSGRSAIALLEQGEKVDLVFSDVVMTDRFSGYDLARWLGKNRPGARLLLTSGFAEEALQDKAEGVGRFRLLRKPYNRLQLSMALHKALTE